MNKLVSLPLLLILLTLVSACQKIALPLADIKEPKDKVEYTQQVRKTEPDLTK